ncbi:unnamed protein product [Schistosoma rodhaini]|uniref:Ig-like domain-containing protein n=1 Tax=Schistosoma rodhaini TaxID=6188 RepID=A0AA85ELF5_9TREM|nr:unnamed protein product [Schistosoma rodhaini]
MGRFKPTILDEFIEMKDDHKISTNMDNILSAWDRKLKEVISTDLSNKTWEGPFYYDVFIGSMITLQCVINESKIEDIYIARNTTTNIGNKSWALLWIHNTWTNVIDPWLGDGRRSYNPLDNNRWEIPNIDLSISQAYLSIIDVDPTDVGVYACVMVTYSIQFGYSPVDLKQTQLISIHMVRIHSNLIVAPDCRDEDNDLQNRNYCKTGFEQWRFNVYYPTDGRVNITLFHAPCNADIFLTALTMNNVDPTFWSIGWKFVPYGQIDDTKVVEMNENSNIQLLQPSYKYLENPPIINSSLVKFNENVTYLDKNNLLTRQIHALTYWKANWLALNSSIKQKSGAWQCWIQRSIHKNDSFTTDIPHIRWLTNEVHVKIIPRKYINQLEVIIELWRIIALIMAPLDIFLLFILFTVGWYLAYYYESKSKSRTKSNNTCNAEESSTQSIQQHRNSDESEQIFIPTQYVDEFLQNSGVESYKEYIIRRNKKRNFNRMGFN